MTAAQLLCILMNVAKKRTINRKPLNPLLPRPYGEMTAAQFDAEVEKFRRPMLGLPGKPLTRSQKAQHRLTRSLGQSHPQKTNDRR